MSAIDPDRVPRDLDEAVDIIVAGLAPEDRRFFEERSTTALHHTGGRYIRNAWSLWDRETHLVQWFRANLRIGHADDISAVILSSVQARVIGVLFEPRGMVARFHEHWRKFGCNEFGEKIDG